MAKPPTPGTPMESLMLLVWKMRSDLRFQEMRLVANTLIVAAQPNRQDADTIIQGLWKDYRGAAYPFEKAAANRQDEAALDYLRREVAGGPLAVRPMAPLTVRSSRRGKRTAKK
jgi:hypothetical protein